MVEFEQDADNLSRASGRLRRLVRPVSARRLEKTLGGRECDILPGMASARALHGLRKPRAIEGAVATAIETGRATKDVGGKLGTAATGRAVVEILASGR